MNTAPPTTRRPRTGGRAPRDGAGPGVALAAGPDDPPSLLARVFARQTEPRLAALDELVDAHRAPGRCAATCGG